MTYSVGDKISVYRKKGGTLVGTKSGNKSVGNKTSVNNAVGVTNGEYSVGDKIVVWRGNKHRVGMRGGSVENINIPSTLPYSKSWHGYGTYLWQTITIWQSLNREDLGLYVVQRLIDSDNLKIKSAWRALEAEDEYVRLEDSTYYWEQPPYAPYREGVGDVPLYLGTDTDMYMCLYTGYTDTNFQVYSFDRNNGGINYIGKFFRSGSFEMLLDMAHFDGSYLYTRSEVYGGGYPGHYEIVKYKTTDLSIAARHPALNSSNSTMPVLTFVGDKAWAVIYSAGNYKYRELNKGDLTPTGDYYNNYILYSSYPFWVGNKPDGSIIWFYGVIKGDESNPGWKKWYSSSGTVSANITPEDETNWL